ncbi:major adhesin Aha1 [Aeromonas diversa CDC 2478-85]|uniref:Major adhesin Aha1 n=1 Tax=Aeromonas diversa CDC 2478-85 TaxID=1268237 RepID=N9TXY8_9GAMM|nr:porin [Aeromonas diversa]ENY70925.1 major adhesin Aha1 [Aeromonas diversa CDC 2478-85]
MKKTILAIAIPALFASAANATVVYDKDGTTFDIYGRVQANYYGEHDNTDAELKGTSRLGWSGKVQLDSIWSAFAKTEWQIEAENSREKTKKNNLDPRHIYVGFDGSQYGKILFGQTDTAFYTNVVERTDIFNEWGSEANFYGSRQEGQVIYMGKWGGFFANASYQTNDENASLTFGSDNNGTKYELVNSKLEHGYAAGLGYDFDFGLGLAAAYAKNDYQSKGTSVTADKEDWALVASYTIGGFYFAGLYNESQISSGSQEVDFNGYELAASYNVDAWTFLTGYNKSEIDDVQNSFVAKGDLADYTYLGVQYSFTPKLKAYTEYKINGIDNMDDEWTVAMQYNF